MTLTTEPGATTEYRVGDGAFQAYTGPFTLAADGTHVVTYRSTDANGNVEADRTVTIRIDRTGPAVACMAAPGVLWPPDGRFVPVAVGLDVDDAHSGPGTFRLDSLTSSEGGTGWARNWRIGFADTAGELQAIRNEKPTVGRTYSLAYTVFDRAGNGTPCTATVQVPRTQSTGGGGTAVTLLAPSAESGTAPSEDGAAGVTASWFTFDAMRLDGRRVLLTLRLPSAGTMRVRGVVRLRGRKPFTLRTRRVAAGSGRNRVTLRIPRRAFRAVARSGRARLVLRVAYRPEGADEWRRRELTVRLVRSV